VGFLKSWRINFTEPKNRLPRRINSFSVAPIFMSRFRTKHSQLKMYIRKRKKSLDFYPSHQTGCLTDISFVLVRSQNLTERFEGEIRAFTFSASQLWAGGEGGALVGLWSGARVEGWVGRTGLMPATKDSESGCCLVGWLNRRTKAFLLCREGPSSLYSKNLFSKTNELFGCISRLPNALYDKCSKAFVHECL